MNPQIQDYNLVSARAAYKPTFTGNFNQNHNSSTSTQPPRRRHVGEHRADAERTTSALNQRTQLYGGQLRRHVQQQPQFVEQLEQHVAIRAYNSTFRVNYTQPMLANFKMDSQRNTLRTTVDPAPDL